MKIIVFVVALVALAQASYFLQTPQIHHVNNQKALWTAGLNEQFLGMTDAELKAFLNYEHIIRDAVPVTAKDLGVNENEIPESYDVRTNTGCGNYILNQGSCGSCWAFAAASSTTDRFCIATKNTSFPVLSPQELVNCDSRNHGCNGGVYDYAHNYIRDRGLSTDKCMSYVSGKTRKAEQCKQICDDGSMPVKFYHDNTPIQYYHTVQDIQAAILTHGSAKLGMAVYADFMSYKSGIYHHVSGSLRGGHALRIIGWGVEDGVDFWTVANSWGSGWGENGYFRIRRGVNESNIESRGAIAGVPLVQ
ncbi:hypothetical protein GEMRC1_004634 [Eukaryota sp. GEM-RC1]